jgi:hypothetical protein
MKQTIKNDFHLDSGGKPAGGTSTANGVTISWQNGPLGRGSDRQAANGAFVETLLQIVADRLSWYNANGFSCRENSLAITKVEEAIHWLESRTARRELQGVEGTNQGN